MMESLANYSALMFIEKKKGRKAMEAILADYKTHLLQMTPEGRTLAWRQRSWRNSKSHLHFRCL